MLKNKKENIVHDNLINSDLMILLSKNFIEKVDMFMSNVDMNENTQHLFIELLLKSYLEGLEINNQ